MKKIFTLMVLMMMAPWVGWGQEVWNGTADTKWYNDNPDATEFTINTAEELAGLAELVNERNNFDRKTVKLGKDIILNENSENYRDWENQVPQNVWVPIGKDSDDQSFCGTFDGNGYTIKGLYCKGEKGENNYGLFGMISTIYSKNDPDGTKIENVKVVDSYIESFGGNVGGITGQIGTNAIISNCYFDGLIKGHDNVRIGGICGGDGQMGIPKNKIEECHNAGDIIVNMTEEFSAAGVYNYIGGIGGNANIIRECYNTGNITISINGLSFTGSDYAYILISGVGFAATMESCYNTGKIQLSGAGNSHCLIGVGGLSGGDTPDIKNSYNYGIITSNIEPIESFMEAEETCGIGSILGLDFNTYGSYSFENNYYLKLTTENINPIGGSVTGCTIDASNIHSATKDEFKKGEVAYLLRKHGFGQDLQDASITSPTLLAFTPGKEVYKLTLDYSGYNKEEQEEKFANSGFLNLPELVATETEKEVGWYDENGTLYTSTSAISDDITLYAKKQTLHNITIEATEGGSVSADKKQAIVGEKITLTVTPDEGYALESISATTEEGEPVDITDNTFIMPDANVTVSATFAKVKYTVTIGELTNGSITIGEEGKTEAVFVPGDPVSLNITPDEGYDIDQLFLNDVEITGTTFEMPAAYVVVTATFKLKPVEDDDEDTGAIKKRYRLYLADQDFYLNDEYDEAGLVLYSRHDKKYTDVGGSFTVWFEKNGEVNEGARVFISNRANGEYKEVKLDEVSGYYQIRNVQSNIYVKLYTEEGFPVANEAIEATEARAYAQANKIVVITPEPTEVQIISIAGAVVATAQVAGQQEFANLTEGVYIVRMGESVVKLQVRN